MLLKLNNRIFNTDHFACFEYTDDTLILIHGDGRQAIIPVSGEEAKQMWEQLCAWVTKRAVPRPSPAAYRGWPSPFLARRNDD